MQTFDMELRNLRSLIHEKMRHTYLDKYVDIPEIDNDKLFILKIILDDTELTGFQKKNYIITTMLVQMALDTHDLVPQSDGSEQTESEKKAKQLSVLAGDYYSGLYYLILSNIEDIELVHTLAAAIKEINECKMQLYYHKPASLQEFLTAAKKLDSLLIMYVAEFVHEKDISDITGDWLLTKKLLGIKQDLELDDVPPLFTFWSGYTVFNDHLKEPEIINEFIFKNVTYLKDTINNFPDRLTSLKAELMNRLNEQLTNSRIIVEEG